MDIRKLQRAIVDGLEDVKAQHIVVFNTEHLSALFERVIIASGTSNRQTKSLASSVRESVKQAGYPVPRTEGESNGEWIVVDCGAAVVHVMQPLIREYYHLEEIWGDKPVKVKLGSSETRLVKAAESDDDEPAPRRRAASKTVSTPAPKRAAARKAVSPPVVGRKSAAGKTTRGAAVARKAPPRPSTLPGKVVTRVVGVKRAAATKSGAGTGGAAKRPAATARQTTAGKPMAAKTAARRTAGSPATRKTAARKSTSRT